MDGKQEYDFTKLKNLESIKDYCNSHLFDIANGGLRTEKNIQLKSGTSTFTASLGIQDLDDFSLSMTLCTY
jgi:hypothetical protein